jgi:hypothetical protein
MVRINTSGKPWLVPLALLAGAAIAVAALTLVALVGVGAIIVTGAIRLLSFAFAPHSPGRESLEHGQPPRPVPALLRHLFFGRGSLRPGSSSPHASSGEEEPTEPKTLSLDRDPSGVWHHHKP